jgi:hypothetical protein
MESFKMNNIEFRWFDQKYAVSYCGKVLRKYTPYTPTRRSDGYLSIGSHLMHRVLAFCWLPNFDPSFDVHHKDENKAHNHCDNLECLSTQDHRGSVHGQAQKGYTRTPETRDKIRQSRLGKATSEATKEKQRAALIGKTRPYFIRAAHSEESRLARSENHVRSQSCSVNGVEYASFAIASKATGVHRFTIRKRCLSKNFPEYQILTPKS